MTLASVGTSFSFEQAMSLAFDIVRKIVFRLM